MTLNKLLIIGHVGAEPQMRYTSGGTPVTSFSVATSEKYTKADGQKVEETDWFTVTCWNKLAETTNEYVYSGMTVCVEGRIKLDEWQGQDGENRSRMAITATRVLFLSKRDNTDNTRESSNPPDDDDDDLPWN